MQLPYRCYPAISHDHQFGAISSIGNSHLTIIISQLSSHNSHLTDTVDSTASIPHSDHPLIALSPHLTWSHQVCRRSGLLRRIYIEFFWTQMTFLLNFSPFLEHLVCKYIPTGSNGPFRHPVGTLYLVLYSLIGIQFCIHWIPALPLQQRWSATSAPLDQISFRFSKDFDGQFVRKSMIRIQFRNEFFSMPTRVWWPDVARL